MESFKFVSERGSIEFSLVSKYVFSSAENINSAQTRMQEDKYIGMDGAEYSNILYEPDDITIKGFVKTRDKTELSFYRAQLYKILNGKEQGTLFYNIDNKCYFTEVLPLRPEISESTKNILSFVAYFKKVNTLWKVNRLIKNSVYKITKNLKTQFTLPCVFSNRLNAVSVLNTGDIPCGCVVIIRGMGKGQSGSGVNIFNHTTNEKIYLDYCISEGELIEIDTMNYTVQSSINNNIINKVSADSKFFKLVVGINEIEVLNSDAEFEIVSQLQFYNVVLGV